MGTATGPLTQRKSEEDDGEEDDEDDDDDDDDDDEDDEDLYSEDMFMLQQHAHCAFKTRERGGGREREREVTGVQSEKI